MYFLIYIKCLDIYLLLRWEVLLKSIMRLQTVWCKNFGTLQWIQILWMMMKQEGCKLLVEELSWFWSLYLIFLSNSADCSENSLKLLSEVTETGKSLAYPSTTVPTAFAFKIQDRKGRMHRFTCGMLLIFRVHSLAGTHKVVCFWTHAISFDHYNLSDSSRSRDRPLAVFWTTCRVV